MGCFVGSYLRFIFLIFLGAFLGAFFDRNHVVVDANTHGHPHTHGSRHQHAHSLTQGQGGGGSGIAQGQQQQQSHMSVHRSSTSSFSSNASPVLSPTGVAAGDGGSGAAAGVRFPHPPSQSQPTQGGGPATPPHTLPNPIAPPHPTFAGPSNSSSTSSSSHPNPHSPQNQNQAQAHQQQQQHAHQHPTTTASGSSGTFTDLTPSTYAPAHESRRRNAEQRAATLRADRLIGEVEPNRVFCTLCKKWVQLRQDSSYCAYPWLQHRGKCLARQWVFFLFSILLLCVNALN